MTIQSELLAIQAANPDNILFPAEVVSWARERPGSALHRSIEWDDTRAADQYRLDQVRHLIRLHIIDERGEASVVSLSIDRCDVGGYRSIVDLADRPDLRQVMLEDALADLHRVEKKWRHVKELEEVWAAADAAKLRATRRRTRKLEGVS